MSAEETPLTKVPKLQPGVIKRLQGRWITSAEQLVGLGASPEGVRSLAKELDVSESTMADYLRSARGILRPEVVEALERPVDTSRYPLGAAKPRPPADSER
jgi:hypothetical protein